MRKIDAVLLSALILYDYSAQTLVDSDIMNMGSSYIVGTDNLYTGDLSDPLFPSNQLYSLDEDAVSVREQSVASTAVSKNISYHALAKVKAVATNITETQSGEILDMVQISMPDPLIETAMALPEINRSLAAEQSLMISTVDVSSSFTLLSDTRNIRVEDELKAADLQLSDTDGDGMFNFEDNCPSIPGVARFEGCPVPDSDGDGINDEEDRCPYEQGGVEQGGCPVIENQMIEIDAVNNAAVEEKELTKSSSTIKFDAKSEILSNTEFNILLQLADEVRNHSGSTIEITGTNAQDSEKQVSVISSYLQDLGVENGQIHIAPATKKTGTGGTSAGIQVQVHR